MKKNHQSVHRVQPSFNQIIIRGTCVNTPSNLLIDTGASVSLVNTKLIEQIGMMGEISPTNITIAGLDNVIVPTKGEINLPIKFGNTMFNHNFVVCNELEHEFLIGMDILSDQKIKIDVPNKILVTSQGQEKFLSKPISLEKRLKIRCFKTKVIPANSGGYIMGKIPINKPNSNFEGVIEPRMNLAEKKGIIIAGTLSYTDKNLVPIHYINVMPYDVTIYRNQLIAFIEPFEKFNGVHSVRRVKTENSYYDSSIDLPRLPDAEPESVTKKNGKWDNPQLLFDKLKLDDLDLPEDTKQQLKDLIAEFSHRFSRNRFDLGKASFYEANIKLNRNFTPKWVPVREIPYKLQKSMSEEIQNMEKAGLIEKTQFSLWNSAVMIVLKKDGKSPRFVQDCRALNTQCLQDNYQITNISTILDQMTDCNYLSSLDFTSSFNQLGLENSSRPLTSFCHNGDRYQWTRLVQGHKSSTSQFSRCISQLFSPSRVPFGSHPSGSHPSGSHHLGSSLLVYVDDMLLGSRTAHDHLNRLRFILERLSWANLKLSPDKSKIMRREASFIGHVISRDGIRIEDSKIKAVQSLPPPNSLKKVQQFLGFANWQRSFIKGFATMAAPLYDMLRKGKQYDWTPECQKSFENIKSALTRRQTMALPDISDPHKSYEVTIDSSKRGQGATLTQLIDGKRRVISYWSRAVPKHQQKYGATRLEFLCLYGAIQHWRRYLQGTEFTVITDCIALKNIDTIFSNENSYMHRRLANLAPFSFKILYAPGKSKTMIPADFLSRYAYETTSKEAATQTSSNTRRETVLMLSDDDKTSPLTLDKIRETSRFAIWVRNDLAALAIIL